MYKVILKVQITDHIYPRGTNNFFIPKYKIYIQKSYIFVLYKMKIVSTHHDSTSSK